MSGRTPRRANKRLSDVDIRQLLDDSDEDFSSDSDTEFRATNDELLQSDITSSENESDDEDELFDENKDDDSDDCDGPSSGSLVHGTYSWVSGSGTQKAFPFISEEKVSLPKIRDQITVPEMYQVFVSDEIIQYMVDCTNNNAREYIETHVVKRSSRYTKWTETSLGEIKKFMGLRLWMGLNQMPNYKAYWSNKRLYKNDVARRVMSRDRFFLLLRFWHFGPNNPLYKLHKIQPLITKLIEKFMEAKTPGKYLVVDESMIGFRGRLGFRQYNPQKAKKYGIKVFKCCDPVGYTYNLKLYSGKGSHNADSAIGLPTQVVLNMITPYLNCGRILCTDNWYTSMELVSELQAQRTYLVGTYRKNRKNIPKEVVTEKLKKGATKYMSEVNTGTVAMKWMDKRDVYVLSTLYGPDLKPAPKKTKKRRDGPPAQEKLKPEMIIEYNRLKGGIDISDTLLSYHSSERKSIRWYHKVADNLLFGTCVVNAFILWNTTKSTNDDTVHLDRFRELIVEAFLESDQWPTRSSKSTTHYLQKSEGAEGTSGRSPRGRCRGCYAELVKRMPAAEARNKTKKVSTRCETCEDKPYFCLPCFEKAHRN